MSDPNLISIQRPTVANPVPPVQKLEAKFPTEIIDLPSRGWFYPENSPLSSGKLELKMMTAKEEDILTSKNLIQKHIVLDKLIESVIIDKTVVTDDILVCDRNALLYAIRRLAYGDEYNATLSCGRCSKENNVTIDLAGMGTKEFNFESYPKGVNSFEFLLPASNVTVTYKLPSKRDEDAITRELETFAKISKGGSTKEVTTRLIHLITSVNGSDDKMKIRRFVSEELLSKDSLALRSHIRTEMPDIINSFDFTCQYCELERKEDMPMGISFFWPDR
jgi:hypothetical protein